MFVERPSNRNHFFYSKERKTKNCISSEWYLSEHWRYFVKETESACILPVVILNIYVYKKKITWLRVERWVLVSCCGWIGLWIPWNHVHRQLSFLINLITILHSDRLCLSIQSMWIAEIYYLSLSFLWYPDP